MKWTREQIFYCVVCVPLVLMGIAAEQIAYLGIRVTAMLKRK